MTRDERMPGHGAASALLTLPEQRLYARLVRAFPGHVILAHVALPQMPIVADFLVCRADFTALAVVTLEGCDESQALVDRSQHEDEMLRDAGIKVLRVAAGDLPDEPGLKALVAGLPVKSRSAPMLRRPSSTAAA